MMDFLDPKKRHVHTIKLVTGYVLVAIAVILSTKLLLYAAYGYGLHKGQVIQNGLIFVSSTPSGSQVRLNGQRNGSTGERLTLEAGTYTMKIQRNGYRTWQRAVTVEGGTVEHFDYPFLFPINLTTTTTKTYPKAPSLATQSPDRRWLLIEQPGSLTDFDLYDLKNPKSVKISTISLPAGLLTASTAKQSLKLVDWSNDNRHVLLKHVFGGSYEYILVDTQSSSQSVNLSKNLSLNSRAQLTLQNDAYNHYFVFDTKAETLGTVTLGSLDATPLLQHVLAYNTYGTNIVLYATDQNAPSGQTKIMLHQNNQSYFIRDVSRAKTYLLNLTQYSGSWFVAAGSPSENSVYVYKNPVSALSQNPGEGLAPITVLRVDDPNYLEFSANAQFIMAEHANQFAVYDDEYDKTYAYTANAHFDAPQPHAVWMDGDRINYVSGGKLVAFDYDSTNFQTLMAANPHYVPFFGQNYRYVYALAQQSATAKTAASTQLTSTALLTPADQ
ncbi:MAG TPA: PEGA domain-containing protein [Candidatus Saccharimonadales bacterium]|jgi:hypothetical protein